MQNSEKNGKGRIKEFCLWPPPAKQFSFSTVAVADSLIGTKAGEIDSPSFTLPHWTDQYPTSFN